MQQVEVLLQGPIYKSFSYLISEQRPFQASELVGKRVLVPFGNKRTSGFIIALQPRVLATNLKQVSSIIDEDPLINTELLDFLTEVAHYYLSDLGDVIANALPPSTGYREKKLLRLTEFGQLATVIDPQEQRILDQLAGSKGVSFAWLVKASKVPEGIVKTLLERGMIEEFATSGFGLAKEKRMLAYKLGKSDFDIERYSIRLRAKITALQKALAKGSVLKKDLMAEVPQSSYALKKALADGLIVSEKQVVSRQLQSIQEIEKAPRPKLTADQKKVLEQIAPSLLTNKFREHLLHGVTGSGKTEIYLRLTEQALETGRGTIVLVPEISLTPQLIERMTSRFGKQISILHSNLGAGERLDQWRAIASGQCRIVVGARSAIFAPMRNLGLVIVDEEHDPSYKQDERLTYHGRDLARIRAKLRSAVLVLGSATPSIESYYKTEQNDVARSEMPNRIGGLVPKVELIDMRQHKRQLGRATVLSKPLVEGLKETLMRKESAILFLNRRGYTPTLLCPACGESPKCQNCSVSLTYHKKTDSLLCHYCGFEQERISLCEICGQADLVDIGIGTERLENELKIMFPDARIARMDRDTTRTKDAHSKLIGDLQKQKTDILVGTQMVTKGLDVAHVTLVGVLSADLSLHLPDFRASERTFQLATQVAGRAGRGDRPGYVFIQTFNHQHVAFQCARHENYRAFYEQEIESRRQAFYPPFSRLMRLKFRSANELSLRDTLDDAFFKTQFQQLTNLISGQLVGPSQAPIRKLYGKFRWHALLKFPPSQPIQALKADLTELKEQLIKREVEFRWDIDPVHFL